MTIKGKNVYQTTFLNVISTRVSSEKKVYRELIFSSFSPDVTNSNWLDDWMAFNDFIIEFRLFGQLRKYELSIKKTIKDFFFVKAE